MDHHFLPSEFLLSAGGTLFFVSLFGVLTYALCKWSNSGRQYDGTKDVILLTDANTADLPAPDSLVRASQEPVQAYETVLLRAASDTHETQAGQLLWAGTGEE